MRHRHARDMLSQRKRSAVYLGIHPREGRGRGGALARYLGGYTGDFRTARALEQEAANEAE